MIFDKLTFLDHYIFNHKVLFKDIKMYKNLRNAIKRKQIFVYYQPQIDVKSNKLIGVEALARWCIGGKKFISPNVFIPLAERTGLIFEIQEYILRTACIQNKKWQDLSYPPIFMSVNLSPNQFMQDNLFRNVKQVLKETRLEGRWLRLEITESAAINNIKGAAQVISKFKEMDIGIELDDFGTVYSSFNYLKNFSIDVIKIEQSFVKDLIQDCHGQVITKAIIDLAHNLGILVTAEGVETQEQFMLLKKQQCDVIQGYYFSKPLPEDEVEEIIKKGFF